MPTQTTNLFLLEDLEDVGRTSELAKSDLDALQTVADWIKTFVVKPHEDLGHAGPVCPFVPGALERKTLWLAPQPIAGQDAPHVVELINGYKRLFLDAQPTEGDDANYKVIVVVFTDLPTDRAQGVFDDVLQHLAAPSYVEDGIVFGPFYEGNEGTAIYNSSFRPFREAWRHQRLEVLPGGRGLAQLVGTSLWRIRSRRFAPDDTVFEPAPLPHAIVRRIERVHLRWTFAACRLELGWAPWLADPEGNQSRVRRHDS
jgi:hypothetical protein